MTHQMNLRETPFLSIKNGKKQIEIRLYDEKRQLIKINDIIEFTNLNTEEKLSVKVIDLKIFKNFKELFDFYDKTTLGYSLNDKCSYLDMNTYYSNELQSQYKALAIKIELI